MKLHNQIVIATARREVIAGPFECEAQVAAYMDSHRILVPDADKPITFYLLDRAPEMFHVVGGYVRAWSKPNA